MKDSLRWSRDISPRLRPLAKGRPGVSATNGSRMLKTSGIFVGSVAGKHWTAALVRERAGLGVLLGGGFK